VRFVNSLGLGKCGVRFKFDAEATWPPARSPMRSRDRRINTIAFKGL
jgi:hypothetical protein